MNQRRTWSARYLERCAVITGRPLPQSNERMLKGGRGTCCAAMRLKQLALVEGAKVSTMVQLADWTANSDKVLVF